MMQQLVNKLNEMYRYCSDKIIQWLKDQTNYTNMHSRTCTTNEYFYILAPAGNYYILHFGKNELDMNHD